MELELLVGDYGVELSLDQWTRLTELDYSSDVTPPLQDVGATSIKYAGHLGRVIYFTASPSAALHALDRIQLLMGE